MLVVNLIIAVAGVARDGLRPWVDPLWLGVVPLAGGLLIAVLAVGWAGGRLDRHPLPLPACFSA